MLHVTGVHSSGLQLGDVDYLLNTEDWRRLQYDVPSRGCSRWLSDGALDVGIA